MRASLLAVIVLLLLHLPAAALPTSDAGLAMKLLDQMKQNQNAALSPLSLQVAFGMLAAGARGPTQTEILQGLALGDDYLEVISATLDGLARDGAEVAIANRLWTAERIPLQQAYLKTCRDVFGAEPQPLDFGQTEKARRTINQWVAEKTREKIPQLLPSGLLDNGTVLVLTNAVYFKGAWAEEFSKEETRKSPFHGPTGTFDVPMMHRLGSFDYHESASFQAVRLGYKGSRLTMIVLVPQAREGWKALRHSLDDSALHALVTSDWEEAKVDLYLPRFKVKGQLPVVSAMKSLGIQKIFGGNADLSGISSGLSVDDAVHEAVVEVNEEGTEAAAATAISASRSLPRVHKVLADRPFLFLIGDTSSGQVLFVGQVVEPEHAN